DCRGARADPREGDSPEEPADGALGEVSETAACVLGRKRIHAHAVPLLVLVLEPHLAGDDGEQRVIGASAHVQPGMELGPPLFHEDRARRDELAGEALHAEILRSGIAAVARGSDTLLVCHLVSQSPLSLTSAILISVNCCRCPPWRR